MLSDIYFVCSISYEFLGQTIYVLTDQDCAYLLTEHAGLSEFARDVLAALSQIPYGAVVSYRDLAVASGHPSAHRATGSIMAGNGLPILLPCHRVIHSDGRLGRYNGDPGWKARLLRLEGVRTDGEKVT